MRGGRSLSIRSPEICAPQRPKALSATPVCFSLPQYKPLFSAWVLPVRLLVESGGACYTTPNVERRLEGEYDSAHIYPRRPVALEGRRNRLYPRCGMRPFAEVKIYSGTDPRRGRYL